MFISSSFDILFSILQRCVRKVLELVLATEGKKAATDDQVICAVFKIFASKRRKHQESKKQTAFKKEHQQDSQEMRDYDIVEKNNKDANKRHGRKRIVRTH